LYETGFIYQTPKVESEQPKFKHDTTKGWSKSDKGERVYEGPIHKVTFPPPCLAYNELMGWIGLGYYAIGRGTDIRSDRTIRVYNHIDPNFQVALEESGVVFETEPNGRLEI
jgi:hypothetical protein